MDNKLAYRKGGRFKWECVFTFFILFTKGKKGKRGKETSYIAACHRGAEKFTFMVEGKTSGGRGDKRGLVFPHYPMSERGNSREVRATNVRKKRR